MNQSLGYIICSTDRGLTYSGSTSQGPIPGVLQLSHPTGSKVPHIYTHLGSPLALLARTSFYIKAHFQNALTQNKLWTPSCRLTTPYLNGVIERCSRTAPQRSGLRTPRTSSSTASVNTGIPPGQTQAEGALAGATSISSTISRSAALNDQRNKSRRISKYSGICGRVTQVCSRSPFQVSLDPLNQTLCLCPEFTLVAGPDALSEGSSTSDRYSPPQRCSKLTSRSPNTRRRPSISHSSPPSTPTSYDSEYSDSVVVESHRPQSLHLSPSIACQQPPIKSEHMHSPQTTLFEHPGLPALPEVPLEQPLSMAQNHAVGFCLWAQNVEPTFIDVDALAFVDKPTSPGAPVPPQIPMRGTPRACLRITLRLPSGGSACDAMGFSGAVTFSHPLAPSARVVTRLLLDGAACSQEVQPLVPVHDQASAARSGQSMHERYVAMLPDSCLSRCRLINTEGKKARIIQQVIVDAEPLFVVGYDLFRLPVATLSAELSSWTKVVDNRPPPEPSLEPLPMSAGRFGGGGSSANDYLYSTAASLPTHAPRHSPYGHARGHSVGSPTVGHPVSPTSVMSTSPISEPAPPGSSPQTTPTHTSFALLGSPISPTSPHGGSSSGSSTARSRSGFTQGSLGMVSGVGYPLANYGHGHGHGHSHGSLMGPEGFAQDPWTTSLLPLF